MQNSILRRSILKFGPLTLPWSRSAAAATQPQTPSAMDTFPMQPQSLVREMVTVSHGNLKRVRELVEARPSLAKAAWDWGFGDWETALGAASHTGSLEIAKLLIEKGARPTLFSATMMGHIDVVKAFVAAQPGVQGIPGPHGISLLAHARNGGVSAEPVRRYLESLGGADAPAAVPLDETELARLTGTYSFGSGSNERIEITAEKGHAMFTRVGTTTRGLVHLGEQVFHPAGAEAVRVRFTKLDGDAVLTVHDPDLVLTARR